MQRSIRFSDQVVNGDTSERGPLLNGDIRQALFSAHQLVALLNLLIFIALMHNTLFPPKNM